MEKNSAAGLALPDNVSSFYERQYNLDADADDNADVEQDEFNYTGQHRRPLHLYVETDGSRNDTNHFFDDEIETIALEYDMGISNETKLCSRWFRRFFSCLPCCRRSHEIAGDGLDDKPSNEELLSIAFISFLSFTIAQAVASYFARSQAMLGDSIAMGVDAFTYGFNLIAERMKNRADVLIQSQMELEMRTLQSSEIGEDEYEHEHEDAFELNTSIQDDSDIERKADRAKRKLKLTLELVPPLISVVTLAAVTAFILHESVAVLVLDSQRDVNLQDSPDVSIMFVFSFLNLVVDGVNIVFFSKADHAFGYDTFEEDVHEVETSDNIIDRSGAIDNDKEMQSNGEVGKYANGNRILSGTGAGVNVGTGAEGDVIGNGNDSANVSPRSKRKGPKEQIADNFKHIIGERTRRKGGAYATVGEMDDDDDFDDALEEEYVSSEHDLNLSFEGVNGHDHAMFSIDDDDDNDNKADVAVEQKGKLFLENDTHSPDDNDGSPSVYLNSSMDEDVIEHQFEQYYYVQKEKVNLNMCSAYTHVFADTVRSLAVLIASLLGKYVDAITPEVADAIAAVVVSGIILTALIPLLTGMVRTACELISIRQEEALEEILKKHRMATGTMA